MTRSTHDEDGRHPICDQLRALRKAAGLSLANVEERYGIPAVVVGSYERGDRQPGLNRVARVLALYGYELRAVPIGAKVVSGADLDESVVLTAPEIASMLRHIADQVAARQVDNVLARVGAQRVGE